MPLQLQYEVQWVARLRQFVLAVLACVGSTVAAPAQETSIADLLSGVVQIKTFINPDARTIENLGREREGTGVVLDNDGLVLTIGYLMVEAHAAQVVTQDGRAVPANIVGYDHETGFGLIKAISPLKVRPMQMGRSAAVKEGDALMVASYGGSPRAIPVRVVSKRDFAGSWEYLLEDAIFTSPPHPAWSGSALVNRDGRLVGIGSLIVNDASGGRSGDPGNMFVPIDKLQPIFGDLISDGHSNTPPVPWLGLTTEEYHGALTVLRAVPGGPAEKAGIKRGDVIVGVDGQSPRNLIDFYRKIRQRGSAGVAVPLDIEQGNEKRRIEVKSMNRRDHLKLNSTF